MDAGVGMEAKTVKVTTHTTYHDETFAPTPIGYAATVRLEIGDKQATISAVIGESVGHETERDAMRHATAAAWKTIKAIGVAFDPVWVEAWAI